MKFPFDRDIELVNGYCSAILTDQEFCELERRLRESPELRQLLIEYRSIESALPSAIAAGAMEEVEASATKNILAIRRLRITLLTLAACLLLMLGLYFLSPGSEPQIATVASLTGSVRWTGVGGQVEEDFQSTRALTGGTIECLSVESSAAFEFRDGSAVTISGLSVLTISDNGQKELHLRAGHLSATVEPQPEGKPLRLLTETAEFEVLGTQFDVIATEAKTKITVNEGLVRVRRVTDGEFVDVKAAHSLVTTIEAQEALVVTPVKGPTNVWTASLPDDKGTGQWISAAHALRLEIGRAVEAGEIKEDEIRQVYAERLATLQVDDGVLRAAPMRIGRGVSYLVSVNLPHGGQETVVLAKESRLRIQGRVQQPTDLNIGFSAIHRDTSSGARYIKSFVNESVQGSFDLVIPVEQFVTHSGKGAIVLFGRKLVNVFCSTSSRAAELEITSVELLTK